MKKKVRRQKVKGAVLTVLYQVCRLSVWIVQLVGAFVPVQWEKKELVRWNSQVGVRVLISGNTDTWASYVQVSFPKDSAVDNAS